MKRLVRSRDEKILFGVCGGVAEYFGIDANVVRLVWILSVLLGGFGLIPYVAAIFLLPEEDTATSAGSAPGTSAAPATRIFGLVLMGLGALLLFRAFGLEFRSHTFRFWHFEVLAPIVLLGAGALLIWPRTRSALGFGSERKARRSVTDRVIAGVCGGIAREAGVDANFVRLLFILAATLTTGFFLLVYVLLILILPEEEVPRPDLATSPGPASAPPPPPAGPTPRAPAPASESPGTGSGPGVDPDQGAEEADR